MGGRAEQERTDASRSDVSQSQTATANAVGIADTADATDAHEGLLHGHLRFHRWHRTTGREPLLDLEVLKNRSFTVGTHHGGVELLRVQLDHGDPAAVHPGHRGFSATMSGLIMLPGALGQAIAQFFGGKALDRFGARPVALIGTITLCFGTVMMSLISMDSWIWWVSIWQFIRADRHGNSC